MKLLAYLVLCLLIAATIAQCVSPRTTAQQIRQTRVRRLDEAEGK